MTTPIPDSLRWDAEQGRLLIGTALLGPVFWPKMLKVERSADSLILSAWDGQASAEGQFVCSVTYEDEHQQESDTPYLAISTEQAQTLGLQSGDYSAWAARWDDCIYAIPSREATLEPSDLVAVTLFLTPREVQLLEQLALQHQARMSDILSGFAADLAAGHAVDDDRYAMRSGGSDERMYADAWFQRNLAPGGWAGASTERGEFVRCFRSTSTEEEQ